ncbi:MAG: ABC transporter ATP-binding protein [Myxococcota bacterium]
MTAAAPPRVRLAGLSKSFRGTRVLDAVDLEMQPGERVALVGANGAGKTTLIRCLLGEYTHDGEVSVGGLAPRSRRSEVLSRIGFVPQLPPPLKMPVAQLVRFAASVCGSSARRMGDVARRLGLDPEPVSRRPFERLSGGQKQKLLIAIALGRDSDVLILDEPAANLDPEARAGFFDLLAERPPGTSMLISSHRLDEVAPLVQRVIELDQGRISLDDRVADAGDLSSRLACRLELVRADEAAARTLASWSFRDVGDGRVWEGFVPSPDRLRFLGTVSRYAGLIVSLDLREHPGADS